MRLFLLISIGLLFLIIAFVVYCALRVGAEADRAMEEYRAMREAREAEEKLRQRENHESDTK